MKGRREFLKLLGLLSAGTASARPLSKIGENLNTPYDLASFNMNDYKAPKLSVVRIGFVGLGARGSEAVKRINRIDKVAINALCDIRREAIEATLRKIEKFSHQPAIYTGKEDNWKKMCERNDIDVIYIATHWELHIPIAIYAMTHGKHVAMEIGPAESIEQCWQLVKASEKNKKHCIFLENCCYDFFELLTLNMARQGFFGEIIHCEGAYIHDIAEGLFDKKKRYNFWRLKENSRRNGNLYPTHGFGPICNILNINRGDKLDYLVSMSSDDFTLKYIQQKAAEKDPQDFDQFEKKKFRGNMNTSIIKTYNGKTIMLQHDISSPRVYSRIHLVSGTKAAAQKYPLPGKISIGHESWVDEEHMKQLEAVYTLPLVKQTGEMAKQIGGHGGMDFLMDWRWVDCLRNGLAIDHNVYDAALWMSITPLSEKSVANNSKPINIPDFTNGYWKKNKPLNFSINHENLTPIKYDENKY